MDKGKNLGRMILILSSGFFLTILISGGLASGAINVHLGGQLVNLSLLISLIILLVYAIVANHALNKIERLGNEETSANHDSLLATNQRPHPALNPDVRVGRNYPLMNSQEGIKMKAQ